MIPLGFRLSECVFQHSFVSLVCCVTVASGSECSDSIMRLHL